MKLVLDLHRISKQFQKSVTSLEDVVGMYQAVLKLKGLIEALKHVETKTDHGKELVDKTYLTHFEVRIPRGFGTSLAILRVAEKDTCAIHNKRKYIELETIKSGVYFTMTTLKELAVQHQESTQAYSRTQSGLVKEVVSIASTFTPVLEALNGSLTHLDVIMSPSKPIGHSTGVMFLPWGASASKYIVKLDRHVEVEGTEVEDTVIEEIEDAAIKDAAMEIKEIEGGEVLKQAA
ncbi:hypothetical protein EW146_g7161 [Bondarzewia mesenterica]|uniref:Uncharacterized protein n=1 Tax=Bondarzewia mesenterica TaxID=1095465 RepID=A0A4S4LLL4_9AGAM|nr:hypothetical protein EW146_g7161 [Bondarzewia mesenterica]